MSTTSSRPTTDLSGRIDVSANDIVMSTKLGSTRLDCIATRLLDLVNAVIGLLVLSPLMLLTALAVKCGDGGPIFHRAIRVGLGGTTFRLYKFRTMVVDADRQGAGITTGGDPRITPIGRLLRRTKLDELPQLWNVLRGEMSLVGPRPEDPRYVAFYQPVYRALLTVRPGLTSVASLAYRHEERLLDGVEGLSVYVTTILPAKLALDLAYLHRRTFWTDLGLILRTMAALLIPFQAAVPTPDVAAPAAGACP